MAISKEARRRRIRYRIRKKISGTAQMPRLSVFRSNKEIYAQLIDDENGSTICAASSRDKDIAGEKGTKTETSILVGKKLAKLASEKGLSEARFDRGGYLYHGRVKALAEGAREGGLKI